MAWKQIEATPAHMTYLVLGAFLMIYALFSVLIRNRFHLAEPPIATLIGIVLGPRGGRVFDPRAWDVHDDFMQEFTRVIAGLQVFVVGIDLPRGYIPKHGTSVVWMLGPVMAFGWVVCAALIYFILRTDIPTALIISACLTPTDPVLAASILSGSSFSTRVPSRIKRLLFAESGCNDGISFPFLYVGLSILTRKSAGGAIEKWFIITIVWQCIAGTLIGCILGFLANWVLRFSDRRGYIGPSSFVVYYLLLALFSVGVGSVLGLDDFLVCFAAGAAFSHDGWFANRTLESNLTNILDLMLNSTFFVYFGSVIPWHMFTPGEFTPYVQPWRLIVLLITILLLRRIPVVLALKRFIPDIRTYREALFCGHFGPMGVGALFLTMEARAQLETDTSIVLPEPDPDNPRIRAITLIFPVIAFVVLGSVMIHGLSVAAMSVFIHFRRKKDQRAVMPGGETDPLAGMDHDDSSSATNSDVEDEWHERRARVYLPA